MKVKVEFEIEKIHCIHCPFREQTGWDNCVIQRDTGGLFIEFESFEDQMKNCPLVEVGE